MTRSCLLLVALGATVATACGPAPHSGTADSARQSDSAFAALQARGADPRAMGVDQYTSVHRFDVLPDGGRIELLRPADDSAGIAKVRLHLREIAESFRNGDFSTPAFVHMQEVPGTATMAARRTTISYEVRDLPRGGEVRMTTADPEALAAITQFMKFQRGDHRAGGAGDASHHDKPE